MKDTRLRLSQTKILDEYSDEITYKETAEYFIIKKARKTFLYFPEEGEWCNANIKADARTYYPCGSIKKFIENYVLS